ncbi:MAG TPA: gluconate 2-dehydrogenase subunit 3 family protein [Gemmataceae bacterium]|nr:gluconate 2-dehydrogenase subunit 3 family protein [Gemmataceae bacterium]
MHDTTRKDEEKYPDYDVLSKREGPSWNEKTREVIARRLSLGGGPKFFTPEEFETLEQVAARIVPQPQGRPPIPVAALVDDKLHLGKSDGYRNAGLPRERDAWRIGLKALDAESEKIYAARFSQLPAERQDELLTRMANGELNDPAWEGMASNLFFHKRMAIDVIYAYYAHPIAWSEIGWGGPASPRGYVRMGYDERDPWEAAEVKNGDVAAAQRKNRHVR